MKKIINTIRKEAKMSQEEFAKALGTTAVSINRWENGKTEPNKLAQTQIFEFCQKKNIDVSSVIVEELNMQSNDNDIIVYHGSRKGIIGDIKPNSRSTCDFGKGFYVGTDPLQPLTLICNEKKPKIYTLKLDLSGLNVFKIDICLEWAMLISYYRGYMDDIKDSNIYKEYSNITKGYDIIQGYIADDRMYRVMKSFFEKEITDVALINSLFVLDLGCQYVIKTEKACKNLQIIAENELSELELSILKQKSITRREEAIERTEDILVKYRRVGKYYDEIIQNINN